MGKQFFGVKQEKRSGEILALSRTLVSVLGYDAPTDAEVVEALTKHIDDMRRFRSFGTIPPGHCEDSSPEPAPLSSEKVAGELPVSPSDVAAALDLAGLPVRVGAGEPAGAAGSAGAAGGGDKGVSDLSVVLSCTGRVREGLGGQGRKIGALA